MTTDNYTMKVLRAEEGKYLTNTDAESASAKVITTEVYLAINDNAERWVEISAEEADAIRAEQDAEMANQRNTEEQ